MENIIQAAVQRGASDLHIKAGDVFRARIDGQLVPLTKQRLTPEQTRAIALKLIPHERDRQRVDEMQDYDCSWGLAGVGRFRVNLMRQRGSFMIVMRVIPFEIPTFEQLGLPSGDADIASLERGLVLVTGVTGSGKSSTQAAMIGYMNQHMRRHIVTLENPIEFLHRDVNSSITQREVGVDTDSFRVGLRAALRQDPDVILIGEMRDTESHRHRAEVGGDGAPGHLDRAHARRRLHDLAPGGRLSPGRAAQVVRLRLAEQLQAVMSQRLLPVKGRKGPRARRRGDGGDRHHPRLHRRPRAHQRDPRAHRCRPDHVRHADLRSVSDGPRRQRAGRVCGREGGGDEPRRLRAEVEHALLLRLLHGERDSGGFGSLVVVLLRRGAR
jgi:twitching motility protein PilT